MKVYHKVARAVKAPIPNKVYGAIVEGITLNGNSVTVSWGIFAHKPRTKKGKPNAKR